ncbi:hypothetical protein [Streptomyces sp. NPDC045251]|uniref:hypothetical protein n=1 Tax=unclassified Streptomyces TaxID=2593676 RepID=UPI0034027455
MIPLFTVSHVHHSARRTGERLSSLLDSVTARGVDVRLISADAHQGRGSARWLDVELYATKGHGYPHADTTEALGSVALVLDSVTGHEVKGFGWVTGGALVGSHAIRKGMALRVRLDVEGEASRVFPLDSRDVSAVPEEMAA